MARRMGCVKYLRLITHGLVLTINISVFQSVSIIFGYGYCARKEEFAICVIGCGYLVAIHFSGVPAAPTQNALISAVTSRQ